MWHLLSPNIFAASSPPQLGMVRHGWLGLWWWRGRELSDRLAGREGTRAPGLGHRAGSCSRRPLRAAGLRSALPRWPRLDSRFPATRRTGRFQPRPIFGESLSRLRHPAPRGRRSWERARRPSCRRGIPEKCIPAAHARVPPPQPRGTPRLAGARSPQHLNPWPQAREKESRNQACAVGEAGGTGRCKDYVTFPVHPAVD